jgi:hypothetical protein
VAPGTGLLRLTRAAFFAVSGVGLASAAHLAAQGDVPLAVALFSIPILMIVVHLLARRRCRLPGLILGMGLTQLGLHLAFMLTSIAPSCGPSSTMTGMAMAAGPTPFPVTCERVGGHGGSGGQLWPSVPMLLAHTLAMLLLVVLLARGEAALWALAACLRFHFPPLGSIRTVPAFRQPPVAHADASPGPKTVHLRTVRRRGPPVLALAVR